MDQRSGGLKNNLLENLSSAKGHWTGNVLVMKNEGEALADVEETDLANVNHLLKR